MAMNIDVLKLGDASARVYQYGVRVDKKCIGKLVEQFNLAHRTYNDIVAEIRHVASDAIEWLQKKAGDEAVQLRSRIAQLDEQWKLAKAADDREGCKVVADKRRELWREWYQLMHDARRKNSEELKALFLNQIGERKECKIYQIRCFAVAQGLGWATGNAVLKAAIQGHKKQWPKFKLPNFKSIAEVPRRTLELQFTTSGGITIDNVLQDKYPEVSMSVPEAGRRAYGEFRMRVGAGDSRTDITGTVYYHRALPTEGRIKYARLVEQRIGKDRKHYIQFVVTNLNGNTENGNSERKPLAALDFGWYYEDNGRRIAGFSDSPEPERAVILRLPVEIDDLLDRSEQKKSERDRMRDEVVAELKTINFDNAPEPLIERLTAIKRLPAQHILSSRLAMLALEWKRSAPDYSVPIFERLEGWRKQDKMLWQAESHLASKARNMRKKHYEKLALEWVQSYENIVIDTPELSDAAKVKDKTTGRHNKLGGIARGGRVRAALYDLQQAIVNAAARFDTTVALIKGRTSKTCSVCRGRMETENDGDRIVTCKGCGAVVDREQNAAAVVWKEAMGQLEAIRAKSEVRSLEHQEALGKRAVRKKARHAARHRARTNSEQETAGDSRNS